jgi:TonB family protein
MKRLLFLLVLPSAALASPLADYPGSSTEHGSVRVQVTVGSDGRGSGCSIVRRSNVASLDSATCPLVLAQARFTPGRDKQGNIAASSAVVTIHYMVPHAQQTEADLPIGPSDRVILYSPSRDAAQRANGVTGPGKARPVRRFPIDAKPDYPANAAARREQGRVVIVLDVDASGKPVGCTVVRTSSYATLDDATCKFALSHFRYRPAADFFGRPIADDDLWTATWILSR